MTTCAKSQPGHYLTSCCLDQREKVQGVMTDTDINFILLMAHIVNLTSENLTHSHRENKT